MDREVIRQDEHPQEAEQQQRGLRIRLAAVARERDPPTCRQSSGARYPGQDGDEWLPR